MDAKRKAKLAVDFAMTAALPCLMAYGMIGETAHEWIGVSMFCLWIFHHILNRKWYSHLARGPYPAIRVAGTALNGVLAFVMISLMVSGIMMSKHVFAFLPLENGAAFARTLHLLASYWGFTFMSLHLGFYWSRVLAAIQKSFAISGISVFRTVTVRVVILAVSIYGIYALISRQIVSYLFLQSQFVFFDFSEPLAAFLADYLAIMILLGSVGFYGTKLLKPGTGRAAA